MREVSGTASPGDAFVHQTGPESPWVLFTVADAPNGFPAEIAFTVAFPGGTSGFGTSGFGTKEEALLFAESLGLKPEVLPFEPSYGALLTTGRIVPVEKS